MSFAVNEAYGKKVLPNPTVGCALLDSSHNVIFKTFHNGPGTDHAESAMIKQIIHNNVSTEDKSLYITLEPCIHEDTSPSCAKLLNNFTSFKEIIIGDFDPDKRTFKKGLKLLSGSNKVSLELGVTNFLDPSYMAYKVSSDKKNKLPHTIMKIAVSSDSYIYNKSGPKHITSNESRKLGHYLRGTVDGILIGKSTLILDNPQLNIRHGISAIQPRKFVLWGNNKDKFDKCLDTFVDFEFLTSFEYDNTRVHALPTLNSSSILKYLYSNKVYSLLIEGGPNIWKQFYPFTDNLYLFRSNKKIISGIKFDTSNELSIPVSPDININLSEDTLSIYNRKVD